MKLHLIAFAFAMSVHAAPSFSQSSGGVAALAAEAAALDRQSAADPSQAEKNVADDFTGLAGSSENAGRLVRGLRSGEQVSLSSTSSDGATTSTTFKPATGKTGLGNVFISLALAQESLKSAGVDSPTNEQLIAALNGGTVTVDGKTVTMKGVLTQRAAGEGWGRIAQSLGVKLGPVISAIKSENASQREERRRLDKAAGKANGSREASAGKFRPEGSVERPARPEKIDRPDKPDRPEKPARPERPARP